MIEQREKLQKKEKKMIKRGEKLLLQKK